MTAPARRVAALDATPPVRPRGHQPSDREWLEHAHPVGPDRPSGPPAPGPPQLAPPPRGRRCQAPRTPFRPCCGHGTAPEATLLVAGSRSSSRTRIPGQSRSRRWNVPRTLGVSVFRRPDDRRARISLRIIPAALPYSATARHHVGHRVVQGRAVSGDRQGRVKPLIHQPPVRRSTAVDNRLEAVDNQPGHRRGLHPFLRVARDGPAKSFRPLSQRAPRARGDPCRVVARP